MLPSGVPRTESQSARGPTYPKLVSDRRLFPGSPARLAGAAILALAAIAGQALAGESVVRGPSRNVSHAIAMRGEPALPADFGNMPYVNPDAPKGGRLRECALGTFDSLNPFIVKGLPVHRVRGYVVESLMTRGQDEAFTLYGLLAQSVETDDARSHVIFHLNPLARFADGTPVRAADVLFSWQLLRDKGRPNLRLYYAKVAKASAVDERTVRFDFADSEDRELPLILALMPILPQHAVDPETFEMTSLEAPLGSGPYRVEAVRAGAAVSLKRNPDYWGRDLPVNRGLWNFDEISIDYYREANGMFEAFKRGLCDYRIETEPLRWHEGYKFPAVTRGEVVLDPITPATPNPSEYLVFNSRRAPFSDPRVRQALISLFDFEWVNQNYFFGLYSRSGGFFAGSELSAYRRPADALERQLLAPFKGAVTPEVLEGRYRLPVSDGSGRDRKLLPAALKLLDAAGYALDGKVMRQKSSGEPLRFEILVTTRDQERIALAFVRDLKRAGIATTVRTVDAVQFDQRRIAYDFDMIQNRWDQSLSPGNEQFFYWGSEAADIPGTRNYMGAKEPAIDAMIRAMLDARSNADFVSATRALDRVLMSGFYAIPLFNAKEQWLARWNRIQRMPRAALAGALPETWWQLPQDGRR